MKTKNSLFITSFLIIGVLLSFLSSCKKDENQNTETIPTNNAVVDVDGNVYHSITIGTQTWMLENLKVTKYNDGEIIPLITDDFTWDNIHTGARCYQNDDSITNASVYGPLYNWYAINTGKLCPTGWHVPSENEWTILVNYLGGDSIAGGKLKESGSSHWTLPNTGATNSSGFSALPGGQRYDNGTYACGYSTGFWWTSTERGSGNAFFRNLTNNSTISYNGFYLEQSGLSVRCIKD